MLAIEENRDKHYRFHHKCQNIQGLKEIPEI